MKWLNCNECEEEFRVISDSEKPIDFCPFCGDSVEDSEDEVIEDDGDYDA